MSSPPFGGPPAHVASRPSRHLLFPSATSSATTSRAARPSAQSSLPVVRSPSPVGPLLLVFHPLPLPPPPPQSCSSSSLPLLLAGPTVLRETWDELSQNNMTHSRANNYRALCTHSACFFCGCRPRHCHAVDALDPRAGHPPLSLPPFILCQVSSSNLRLPPGSLFWVATLSCLCHGGCAHTRLLFVVERASCASRCSTTHPTFLTSVLRLRALDGRVSRWMPRSATWTISVTPSASSRSAPTCDPLLRPPSHPPPRVFLRCLRCSLPPPCCLSRATLPARTSFATHRHSSRTSPTWQVPSRSRLRPAKHPTPLRGRRAASGFPPPHCPPSLRGIVSM